MRKLAFVTLAWMCLIPVLQADNWGHWRGPTGNGIALDASPPTNWSPTKNVKWKIEIPGRGSASPVVWEDSVFVSTAVPTGKNAGRSETSVYAAAIANVRFFIS